MAAAEVPDGFAMPVLVFTGVVLEDRDGLMAWGASDLAEVEAAEDIGGGMGAPKVGPTRSGSNAEAGRRGGPVYRRRCNSSVESVRHQKNS